MAEKKKIHPKDIKPSQNFLKERTIEYIRKCLDEERYEDLPETPIVAQVNDDLVTIDGHNLLSVYDELDRELDVWVVSSADDVPDELADDSREEALKTKFEYLEKMQQKVAAEDITSFAALRLKGSMRRGE